MGALIPSPPKAFLPAIPAVKPAISRRTLRRQVWLPLEALLNLLHVMGLRGTGKSRFLGRILAWILFLLGIPQYVFDSTGATIDNFLDKFLRLPRELQEQLSQRITYVDLSGREGYVMSFPMYYPAYPDESLFDLAQRYPEVEGRIDPDLLHAPLRGQNALVPLATYTGMLLYPLGCPVTEAPDLIRNPERWEGRLERALSLSPEVKPAVDFFRHFIELKPYERADQSLTFLRKLLPFEADPIMRAMFGATEPSFTWEWAEKTGQTVLFDDRHEISPARGRFKRQWVFQSLKNHLKLRGIAGREQRVVVVIDELMQLLGSSAAEQAAMAEDIEEVVNFSRNFGSPVCIAHQNMGQIRDERIRNALMSMGNQLIGAQSDPHSAQYLAEYFYRYNPYLVKDYERVWMTDRLSLFPYVIDYRPVYFTPEEQVLLNSHRFLDLGRFEFIARVTRQEGDLRGEVHRVSIARVDPNQYPYPEWCAQARERLMQRDGRGVADVLAEIEARRPLVIETSSRGGATSPSFWTDRWLSVGDAIPEAIPKRTPGDQPPGMRFQDRDGEILKALHKYGMLTRRHLKEMFFPNTSWRAMEKALSRLHEHGYIVWPTRQQYQTTPGSEPLVWLGWRGILWVARQLGSDVEAPATESKTQLRQFEKRLREQGIRWWLPNFNQLRHDVAIVDFRLSVERAAAQVPWLTLIGWIGERELRRHKGVVPDGYFLIVDENRRQQGNPAGAPLLLEVDEATQPVASRFGPEKVAPYLAFIHSPEYQARFGHQSGCWLVITTGDRRRDNLLKQTEQTLGAGATAFRFSTFEAVNKTENVLTDPIWWQAGQLGPTALFSEASE